MLVDTGILVELVRRSRRDPLIRKVLTHLEGQMLVLSSIQFGELADFARRGRLSLERILRRFGPLLMEVDVDRGIALAASDLKEEARRHRRSRDFSLADGVVLATARRLGVRVLTMDPDFEPFEDAIVLRP